MPIFKAVNECYKGERDFRNLVFYSVYKNGTVNLCGAQAVLMGDVQGMYRQMMDVKKYFHKENSRQALHYILSFSEEEENYIKPMEALRIGYAVAACFPKWQVVFGVHEDTDNLHVHFVVNCTSFVDGKAFGMSLVQLMERQKYVGILAEHCYEMSLPIEERRKRMFRRIEGIAG